MSHSYTPFPLGQISSPKLPANPSAELLLEQFAVHRAQKFVARPLPPCFRLMIGGIPRALPAPGGWAIFAERQGFAPRLVVLGIAEADAKARVEQMNHLAAGFVGGHGWSACATGAHRWN